MPRLIEQPTRVEAAGAKPKLIDEYIGRVNTKTEAISIASVLVSTLFLELGLATMRTLPQRLVSIVADGTNTFQPAFVAGSSGRCSGLIVASLLFPHRRSERNPAARVGKTADSLELKLNNYRLKAGRFACD